MATKMIFTVLALLPLWWLNGCAAVGPDYRTPETAVPAGWSAFLADGVETRAVRDETLAAWWRQLDDPILAELIDRAALGNLDLRQAESRLRQARAERGGEWSRHFPSVNASGSYSRSRTGSGSSAELFQAGLDAAWEIDVFGGTRRAVEAADAGIGASEADLRDVLVSLLAEVALNYIDLRSIQAQLAVATDNLAIQGDSWQLTQWRAEAGLVSVLDVEQARYALEQTRAQVPSLHTALSKAQNTLAVLLALPPGTLNSLLDETGSVPLPPEDITIGLPAEMLRRRPDVRRAERQLAAQTARVGVVTADLYPKITLPGSIGFEALSFGSLLDSNSSRARIAPGFSWNIFDAGRIRSNIEVQNALQEQALLRYEEAVLTALQEVEDALVAFADERQRLEALTTAAAAAERATELAEQQYASGLVDFQVVIESQRSRLNLQSQQVSSEGQVTANLVRLYKSLGGGWEPLSRTLSNEEGVTP